MKQVPGIKKKEIVVGTGPEAVRGAVVVVTIRMYLNHGTELRTIEGGGTRQVINLGRRDRIPGLRYGIEGMRVGGTRTITISPHLAYGATGVPGFVPPDAVIKCEVELLEIREPGVTKPEDYPPGRQLFAFHPGEAARQLSRWQFGLLEDGRYGVTVTEPIPGLPWRHAKIFCAESTMDPLRARTIIEEAIRFPVDHAVECLLYDQLWADMQEKGNSITRDRQSNVLSLSFHVIERGQLLCQCSVKEDCRPFLQSQMFNAMEQALQLKPTRVLSRH